MARRGSGIRLSFHCRYRLSCKGRHFAERRRRREGRRYFKKRRSPLPGTLSLDRLVFLSALAPASAPLFAPPSLQQLAIPGSCRAPKVMERMGRTTQGAAEATWRGHGSVLLSALIHCIPQLSRFVPLPLFASLEYEYTNMNMLKCHSSCTTTTYEIHQ